MDSEICLLIYLAHIPLRELLALAKRRSTTIPSLLLFIWCLFGVFLQEGFVLD